MTSRSTSAGRLKGKVALVTGSSRGIGAQIARAYAREGAQVVLTFRDRESDAHALAEEIGAAAVRRLDVTDRASIRRAFATSADELGGIDVLVNNAGVNVTGDFDRISDDDWDTVVDVDMKGVFLCCQEILPHIRNRGRVINVGSLSGEYGGPRTPSYAAAKAGVMALTHCFARFVAHRGICVNNLSPGVIASDLTERTMPAFLREKVLPLILVGRLGRYDELEEAALFLASDESAYVTAQTISVNGGAWVRI